MTSKQQLYDNLEKAKGKLALLEKTCEAMSNADDEMGGWFDGATAIPAEIMAPVDETLFVLHDLAKAEQEAEKGGIGHD